jgi:hypothetical protein
MEIKTLHLLLLQNEEHYKFAFDFKGLVNEFTPAKLKIEPEFTVFGSSLDDEHAALDIVHKSAFTAQAITADEARDTPTQGLNIVVDGMLHHFDPAIAHAAYNVKVVLDSFAGITRLAYEKQTAATIKLLDNLKGTLAGDIATLGLTAWVTEIEAKNTAFDKLVAGRYDEINDKTRLRMKDVRVKVDAAYKAIVTRINALIIVEGEANYEGFVNKLNLHIDSYNNDIAQRAGINAKAAAAKKAAQTAAAK